MRKALFVIVTVTFFLISLSPACRANIKLVIDNKKVFLDTEPMIRQASGFVPLRGVFEALKAQVSYDKGRQLVTAVRGKRTVLLTVGSNTAKVDGIKTIMPIPAFLYNNRTLVPLRFVTESLGCEVLWEPATSTVYISSKAGSAPATKDPDVDDKIDVDF
jgi:hypothetical protein